MYKVLTKGFYGQWVYPKTKESYYSYQYRCKKCASKKNMEWMKRNKDKQAVYMHRYNTSPERRKAMREWGRKRVASGEMKEWQRVNKDKVREYRLTREGSKNHDITIDEWEDCKKYFNHRCAYCNLKIEEHYIKNRIGNIILGDFHKEHVAHDGSNGIDNCVPSCKSCNSSKHNFELNVWYNAKSNKNYTENRYNKILKWLDEDYRNYLI